MAEVKRNASSALGVNLWFPKLLSPDLVCHLFLAVPSQHAALVEKSTVDPDPVAAFEWVGFHDVCCHFRHHRYAHLITKEILSLRTLHSYSMELAGAPVKAENVSCCDFLHDVIFQGLSCLSDARESDCGHVHGEDPRVSVSEYGAHGDECVHVRAHAHDYERGGYGRGYGHDGESGAGD